MTRKHTHTHTMLTGNTWGEIKPLDDDDDETNETICKLNLHERINGFGSNFVIHTFTLNKVEIEILFYSKFKWNEMIFFQVPYI